MHIKGNHLVYALLLCLLPYGCNKSPKGLSVESDNFEKRSAVGLVINKNYVIQFNKTSSQYVYNIKRRSVRIQTDDQSKYVNALFIDYPGVEPQVGDAVMVEIIYRDRASGPETRLVAAMLVLKREGGKCWLWNEEKKIGLVLDKELFG